MQFGTLKLMFMELVCVCVRARTLRATLRVALSESLSPSRSLRVALSESLSPSRYLQESPSRAQARARGAGARASEPSESRGRRE